MEYLRYKQTPMSNNFKMSITDAVFANKKNDTPNAISSGFNTVDMFSMYDMSIMLKLCLDIWRRQLWMFFEIIAPLSSHSALWNLLQSCSRLTRFLAMCSSSFCVPPRAIWRYKHVACIFCTGNHLRPWPHVGSTRP